MGVGVEKAELADTAQSGLVLPSRNHNNPQRPSCWCSVGPGPGSRARGFGYRVGRYGMHEGLQPEHSQAHQNLKDSLGDHLSPAGHHPDAKRGQGLGRKEPDCGARTI